MWFRKGIFKSYLRAQYNTENVILKENGRIKSIYRESSQFF